MNRKILNIVLAMLMVIGLAAPAFAQKPTKPYDVPDSTFNIGDITEFTVKVRSYQKRAQEQGGEAELIDLKGAQWSLRRVGSMDTTGKVTELTEEQKKTRSKETRPETFKLTEENGFLVAKPTKAGRYELTLVKRPDGFYYGHGTKDGAALETIKFD